MAVDEAENLDDDDVMEMMPAEEGDVESDNEEPDELSESEVEY